MRERGQMQGTINWTRPMPERLKEVLAQANPKEG